MDKSVCAPNKSKKHNFTCFNMKQLKRIANSINESNNNNNIIRNYNSKQLLWNDINKFFISKCSDNDESCWIDQPHLNRLNLQDNLIPKRPLSWNTDDRTWLNTYDIDNVLRQYEKKYKTFHFFGVYPIDYNHEISFGRCIVEELCNIDVKKLIENRSYQLGIVFNLDKHYEPGSHWVSIYIGLNPKYPNYGCFYFDSNAIKPPNEINTLFKNINNQISTIYPNNSHKFNIRHNTVQKQFKNTECGMFSIHFILNCLKKKSFNDIIQEKLYDDDVHKYRYIYYR